MANLRSQLDALASNFATQLLAAIQGASLHELVSSEGRAAWGTGRQARAVPGGGGQPDPISVPVTPKRGENGRLPRRSVEEIQATLHKIVLLVKTHKAGMRAEEIRATLGMEAKEMPRILKEGVARKKLTTKGQKRATTYFAK